MGLISLEDIIEEIVGNIFDESDLSSIGIRKIGKIFLELEEMSILEI